MSKPQQAQKSKDQAARSYGDSISNRAQKPKKQKIKDSVTRSNETETPAPSSSKVSQVPARLPKSANTQAAHAPSASNNSQKQSSGGADRRVVFESTFDTPFRVDWPNIEPDLVLAFLLAFTSALDSAGIANYQAQRGRHAGRVRNRDEKTEDAVPNSDSKSRKKRKRAADEVVGSNASDLSLAGEDAGRPAKKRKRDMVNQNGVAATTTALNDPPPDAIPQPSLLSHILVGVNNVTRRLEDQLQQLSATKKGLRTSSLPNSQFKYILVSTGDIDPPLLVAHIPHLVAGCNSNSLDERQLVVLVPLPKGSEAKLARGFGLPRVSVVGITASAPADLLAALHSAATTFPIVRAPWLVMPSHPPLETKPTSTDAMEVDTPSKDTMPVIHVPTHIKQLRTTAPRNMIAAKRARQEARKAFKARLVLNPAEAMRKTMAGGKPVRKQRVVVTSMSATEAPPS
ncbi:hypothetical protein BKA62DRAFT_617922 [Auriculariales sp. MPI-PUGE-AT-0066]|nr:hypothetical protein BKA62DRAFT_617922 [Auriculariales sp. MPI-PUGE-AT-0066]